MKLCLKMRLLKGQVFQKQHNEHWEPENLELVTGPRTWIPLVIQNFKKENLCILRFPLQPPHVSSFEEKFDVIRYLQVTAWRKHFKSILSI